MVQDYSPHAKALGNDLLVLLPIAKLCAESEALLGLLQLATSSSLS